MAYQRVGLGVETPHWVKNCLRLKGGGADAVVAKNPKVTGSNWRHKGGLMKFGSLEA